MTYQSKESSIDSGEPIELYEFVRGVETYRFNSGVEDIISGPFVYTGSPIKRTRARQAEDPHKDSIKITWPRGDLFARDYIATVFEKVTTVTIKRVHRGVSVNEFRVVWKGRVQNTDVSGEQITMECESVFTSLMRLGLRSQFESVCRHALYSAQCRANMPAQRVDAEVSTHSYQTTITMVAGVIDIYEDGFFRGGILEYGGLRRFITRHNGNTLVLSRRFSPIVIGAQVAVYPGCGKTMQICQAKFNNIDNFGGFPWIPGIDPFTSKIA